MKQFSQYILYMIIISVAIKKVFQLQMIKSMGACIGAYEVHSHLALMFESIF